MFISLVVQNENESQSYTGIRFHDATRLYGMEHPFVRIGSDVSSLISCCIRSVRPGKLDRTSGYCFISVSTSLRCSDVNILKYGRHGTIPASWPSERYSHQAENPQCLRRQLTQ